MDELIFSRLSDVEWRSADELVAVDKTAACVILHRLEKMGLVVSKVEVKDYFGLDTVVYRKRTPTEIVNHRKQCGR